MKTIYKYPIKLDAMTDMMNSYLSIEMQKDAIILHVAVQHEQICIWALVDPTQDMVIRRIRIVGTGLDASDVDKLPYIGSVQLLNGTFVFHIFDAGISLQ